jgi:hypothetical protein
LRDAYEALRIGIAPIQIEKILAIFGQADLAFDQLPKEEKMTPPAVANGA